MKLNMNGDQLLSLGNYALAALGALLMAWGVAGDELKLAQGTFAALASLAVAIWMNVGNLYDLILSVGRRLVMIVFAYATAKGWLTESVAATAVNFAGMILPVLLSQWFYRDKPGPNLPGTTIIDPPKALELTEADYKVTGVAVRDGTPLP